MLVEVCIFMLNNIMSTEYHSHSAVFYVKSNSDRVLIPKPFWVFRSNGCRCLNLSQLMTENMCQVVYATGDVPFAISSKKARAKGRGGGWGRPVEGSMVAIFQLRALKQLALKPNHVMLGNLTETSYVECHANSMAIPGNSASLWFIHDENICYITSDIQIVV